MIVLSRQVALRRRGVRLTERYGERTLLVYIGHCDTEDEARDRLTEDMRFINDATSKGLDADGVRKLLDLLGVTWVGPGHEETDIEKLWSEP